MKSLLQSERDEANLRARKLSKQTDRLQVQLSEEKSRNRELGAQLTEAADYKIAALERSRKIEELQKRLVESEMLRTRCNRKLTVLKEQMRATSETAEQERSINDHSVQLLRDELKQLKQNLSQVIKRESQLQSFRLSVVKLLSEPICSPDYEIISRLQKMVAAHRDFTMLSRRYDEPLETSPARCASVHPMHGDARSPGSRYTRYEDSGFADPPDLRDVEDEFAKRPVRSSLLPLQIENDQYPKRWNMCVSELSGVSELSRLTASAIGSGSGSALLMEMNATIRITATVKTTSTTTESPETTSTTTESPETTSTTTESPETTSTTTESPETTSTTTESPETTSTTTESPETTSTTTESPETTSTTTESPETTSTTTESPETTSTTTESPETTSTTTESPETTSTTTESPETTSTTTESPETTSTTTESPETTSTTTVPPETTSTTTGAQLLAVNPINNRQQRNSIESKDENSTQLGCTDNENYCDQKSGCKLCKEDGCNAATSNVVFTSTIASLVVSGPAFHTMCLSSDHTRLAGLSFDNPKAANDLWQHIERLVSCPENISLSVPGKKKKKKPVQKKVVLPAKSNISQPCQFQHVTSVDAADRSRYFSLQTLVPPLNELENSLEANF
ncbi:Coiled-coil domain-containing protein 170 [Habropoda laboriosa]|uniref:Coiled-coil domain-containing protein 170 n=1 Tax=Habropoda laboriosa TaxID=597456 RepID=A0A0L7RE45_9HYME|nr:Coiled-coil domain-containing protein 170 [Habropoda laboriosa]